MTSPLGSFFVLNCFSQTAHLVIGFILPAQRGGKQPPDDTTHCGRYSYSDGRSYLIAYEDGDTAHGGDAKDSGNLYGFPITFHTYTN